MSTIAEIQDALWKLHNRAADLRGCIEAGWAIDIDADDAEQIELFQAMRGDRRAVKRHFLIESEEELAALAERLDSTVPLEVANAVEELPEHALTVYCDTFHDDGWQVEQLKAMEERAWRAHCIARTARTMAARNEYWREGSWFQTATREELDLVALRRAAERAEKDGREYPKRDRAGRRWVYEVASVVRYKPEYRDDILGTLRAELKKAQ